VTKLTLADISDQRAYEREREAFRATVIALKAVRRIPIGPIVTVVAENATTIRFQIQEMARAEKIVSDAGIETELAIYNPLIPEPGEISFTLFLELTSPDALREWLPRLVGIERSLAVVVGTGDDATVVRAEVDEVHAEQLTRDDITASVHYVRIRLDDLTRARFAAGPASMRIDHPAYQYERELTDTARASIVADWAS
jgi:Protein of unknown function (DUF3501)